MPGKLTLGSQFQQRPDCQEATEPVPIAVGEPSRLRQLVSGPRSFSTCLLHQRHGGSQSAGVRLNGVNS